MSQIKRKPLLNRHETRTLLKTLKAVTTAGALSLTIAGWGLLARVDATDIAQAQTNEPVAMVSLPSESAKKNLSGVPANTRPTPTVAPRAAVSASQKKINLDIVQWVQDTRGNNVAVVRDRRGNLWYVMGSDIPRLEQGQQPLVRPQLAQVFARTRAS
jgi:hypothetical protein